VISRQHLNASVNGAAVFAEIKNAPKKNPDAPETHAKDAQQKSRTLNHSHLINETFPDEQIVLSGKQ